MRSMIGRGLPLGLVLALLAMVVLALGSMGETQTWDDEADFDGGTFGATLWDPDQDGIVLTGRDTFWKYRSNPVVAEGAATTWEDDSVMEPCVVFAKGQYHLFYVGYDGDGTDYAIGLARSDDGLTYSKYTSNPVITKSGAGYDSSGVRDPFVIYEDGLFKMWYTALNGAAESIAYATSTDGTSWTKYASNPVIAQPTLWATNEFGDPCVIMVNGQYWMYLSGGSVASQQSVGLYFSDDGIAWTAHDVLPILKKAPSGDFGSQEILDVAVVHDGEVFIMYFTGRNGPTAKYKIGIATSYDGKRWIRHESAIMDTGITFDTSELQSPCIIVNGEMALLYYHGDDGAGAHGIGLAELKPWLQKGNPSANPVLGTGSTYDATYLQDPCVILPPSGVYTMFYSCFGGGSYPYSIAKATSTTADNWGASSKYASNPVLAPTAAAWDSSRVTNPSVIYEYGVYKMWYSGYDGSTWKIGYATSTDGNTWTKYASNPVLSPGSTGAWDAKYVKDPWVLKIGNVYHMWFVGGMTTSGDHIGHAISTDGTTWTRDSANPVFAPEPTNKWEQYYVSNPCVLYDSGRFVMYYSATYTALSKHRVGRAYSDNGASWIRDMANPVLDWGNLTEWDDDGVMLGSIFVEGSLHHMYYQGYSGSNWLIGYGTFTTYSGTYTTPAIDASEHWPVGWGSLSWDADVPLGTTLRFQVATNNGGSIWSFVGPGDSKDTFYEISGQQVFQFQSGRFMKVRVHFDTEDPTEFEVVLRSITVTFAKRPSPSPAFVTVTSPNGGEDWMKTKDYPITWTSHGNFNSTSLWVQYSTDNGTNWNTITFQTKNLDLFKWTVPSSETSGALIKVTLMDIDGVWSSDISDATFAIDPPAPKSGEFFSPAADEVIQPGMTTIAWNVADPWGMAEAPLSLELTTDGGLTWDTIAQGMPFSDGIQWDVPFLTYSSEQCRLRLSVLTWLGDVSIIESGEFTIDVEGPSISLLTENEAMTEGEEFQIIASVDDDLEVLYVQLHVSGADGERSYPMTVNSDGMWTYPYVPLKEDNIIWASTSDGVHEPTSQSVEIDVRKAATGGSAQTSLALEMVIATGLAVMLLVVVIIIRRRT